MNATKSHFRPPGTRGRLLLVDDDEQIRLLLTRMLRVTGHQVDEAGSAEEAAEILATVTPDLILLDMQLPGKSGQEFLHDIRSDPRLQLTPVVMITGAATQARRVQAIEAGVTDFLAKPFSHVELAARVRSLLQLKFITDALENAEEVIFTLAATIDARDAYTSGHSARVSLYAGLLGERLDMDEAALESLRRGGLFHDFGKIAIRDRVLLKPGKLTAAEYEEIRQHPRKGRDLLLRMRTLTPALAIVYHHHERMDGSGYPDGLMGNAIPIGVRATTIADVFDALTTARVYRGALSRADAVGILASEVRKGWWDASLLDEFLGVLAKLPENDERITRLSRPQSAPDFTAVDGPLSFHEHTPIGGGKV